MFASKQALYLCLANLLAMQFLLASPSRSQSMENTHISIRVKRASLEEVLHAIEAQSDFVFAYDESLSVKKHFTMSYRKVSVATLLRQVSNQSGISFKQINNNIGVYKDAPHVITKTIIAPAIAQVVKGRVVDGETNEPMPGVNVTVKGTAQGTITDTDGQYTLEIPDNDAVLIFSFVGYNPEELPVGNQSMIDVALFPDITSLQELVVVGYGTQKKSEVTGSVSTVDMEKVKNRPITNSSQVMQGVTGLYVNQAGGQPGKDGTTIRLRGQGTLNNNDPLILVDGVEYPLDAVNPNDIASVTVLKDAASAAIYGNRAANGVILVTTKHGVEENIRIEYNNYFGVQTPTYLPNLITDPVRFMELRNQAQTNAGLTSVDYSDDLIEEYKEGRYTDPYTYPNNNWLDIMFSPAAIQSHNLRFSGGSQKATYSLSLGYLNQDGVLMSSGSDRYSIRSNVSIHAKEWLEVGADISVFRRNIDEPTAGVYNTMQMTFKAQGFHPTYLEDGRYANTFIKTPGHNVYRHPIVLAKEGFRNTKSTRSLVNLYTNITLPAGFTYNAKLGVNTLDEFYSMFVPQIYYYQVKTLEASTVDFYTSNRNRHLTNQDNGELNTTFYQTLKWQKDLGDLHHVKGLLGSSYESFYSRNTVATIEGFLGNNLHELDAGSTNQVVSGTSSKNRLVGFFGRFNYDYDEKYLLEANFRYDGSSRFARNNRWGFFPSVSAGWHLDQEDFLKDVNWLTWLRLTGSYGQLGNQNIDNFKYVNLISTGYDYTFNGTVSSGAAVTSYNDPNITWETTSVTNLSVDASFLEDHFGVIATYYNKVTSDILRAIDLPAQVGNLGGPVSNIGEVSNKGIELTLNVKNNIGKDFFFNINAGINYNVNKVEKLNGQTIYNGNYITTKGHQINSYYVLKADGIFQTQEEIDNSPYQNSTTKPGYLKFKNQNDDDEIDEDDRIIVGGVIPKYTYSFNITLDYKNFTLTGFFQGVQDVYTYPQGIVATPFWYGTSVTKEWVNNSWTPERTNAKLPIMTTYESSVDDIYRGSTFWLKDASYLRLKNVQLTYTVPTAILERLRVKNASVFVNGQNLVTFSKMKDFDPEKNITNGNYYEYPSVKTYTAGLNVTF